MGDVVKLLGATATLLWVLFQIWKWQVESAHVLPSPERSDDGTLPPVAAPGPWAEPLDVKPPVVLEPPVRREPLPLPPAPPAPSPARASEADHGFRVPGLLNSATRAVAQNDVRGACRALHDYRNTRVSAARAWNDPYAQHELESLLPGLRRVCPWVSLDRTMSERRIRGPG